MAKQRRLIVARYDAAQDSPTNRRHWAQADGLSAAAANSPEVRAKLRNRARYERDNNPYFLGLVLSIANDVQGTGPRLQILSDDEGLNQAIEQLWTTWSEAARLPAKLWTMTQAKLVDGEAFALLTTNPRLRHAVKLDVQLVEADQVAAADPTSDLADGIEFDAYGNPVAYSLLEEHPGDAGAWQRRARRIPARYMLHWFRQDRPGQIRGIPEITAALPLGAQLRRWTLATLTSAEVAAAFSGVLKSAAAAEEAEPPEPFDELEFSHGMFTTLPQGYDLQQLEPKQPTGQYAEFKHELLDEMGRCRCVPSLVMRGNSANYNFSSARVDRIAYARSLDLERASCERVLLRPLFEEFLAEAGRIPELLPRGLELADWQIRWLWDGLDYVDPQKEASADEIALKNGFTTLAEICGRHGRYWADVLRQRARELARARELGLADFLTSPGGKEVARVEDDSEAD